MIHGDKWRFPTPNRSKLDYFSIETHVFWVPPI
jgi:hypothetical protein